MDVHNLPGTTTAAVAEAHIKDLQTRDRHGVGYLRYWVNEEEGKVFCPIEAPDATATNTVHRGAHGLAANVIYEVSERS
jgi:hypothetical protein